MTQDSRGGGDLVDGERPMPRHLSEKPKAAVATRSQWQSPFDPALSPIGTPSARCCNYTRVTRRMSTTVFQHLPSSIPLLVLLDHNSLLLYAYKLL